MKHKCLTIAGFDASGGADIQADLKTFTIFGCYGMSILTALPIQNTCGVSKCYELPASAIYDQLVSIFSDITPTSIKIGMLFSREIINLVADFLKTHAQNIPIILDPVMVAKSNDPLLKPDAINDLKTKLLPIVDLVTPNIEEAHKLIDYEEDNFIKLGKQLLTLSNKANVLLKGGHNKNLNNSDDLFLDHDGNQLLITAPRIISKNTHGTGCTLSAAICSAVSLGYSYVDACKIAKHYLFYAINSCKNLSVGGGNGPVNHLCHLENIIKNIVKDKYLKNIQVSV